MRKTKAKTKIVAAKAKPVQALVVTDNVSQTPMQILGQAISRGATVEVLERLLSLQERWEKGEARKAFDAAIAKAKGELPVITKDTQVNFESSQGSKATSYMHETMAGIAKAIDPVLTKYGLHYRFKTDVVKAEGGDRIYVTCILSHEGGHSEENTLSGPPDTSGKKNQIQAIGSTVTYLERYTLKAGLGLAASADTDANVPDEPISEEQAARIDALLKETRTDLTKFLAWAKVDSIKDIRLPYYQDCIDTLETRKEKK